MTAYAAAAAASPSKARLSFETALFCRKYTYSKFHFYNSNAENFTTPTNASQQETVSQPASYPYLVYLFDEQVVRHYILLATIRPEELCAADEE